MDRQIDSARSEIKARKNRKKAERKIMTRHQNPIDVMKYLDKIHPDYKGDSEGVTLNKKGAAIIFANLSGLKIPCKCALGGVAEN